MYIFEKKFYLNFLFCLAFSALKKGKVVREGSAKIDGCSHDSSWNGSGVKISYGRWVAVCEVGAGFQEVIARTVVKFKLFDGEMVVRGWEVEIWWFC